MIVESSRFHTISGNAAKYVVGLLFALIVASLWPAFNRPASPPPSSTANAETQVVITNANTTDLALYSAIVSRIEAGENYYTAAASEQRQRGFPLQPFVTVRMPSLAWMLAGLGKTGAFALALTIGMAALLAWHQKLEQQGVVAWRRWTQVGLLTIGLTPLLVPEALYFHEVWAGALIVLSLGLYRPNFWLPSVMIAACALAIRELALPFVLLMTAFALVQRRWAETAAWVALTLAFFAALFIHSQAVSGVVIPTDLKSPPWLLLGGPSEAFSFLWQSMPAFHVPPYIAFPLITLSLFGWLCWRSEAGLFVLFLLLGYMLAFSITGRPNNYYWGFLVSPLLMIGIIFVGPGLQDLQAAIKRARQMG